MREAAEQPAEKASDVSENVESDKVLEKEEAAEVSKSSEKNAERATIDFRCELCDFQTTRKSGLTVHMSRKHPRIEQLDGHSDKNEAEDEAYAAQFKDEEEDMEHYLRTGIVRDESDFFWYFLSFVIHKAGNPGDELFVALEARKKAIEMKNPGTYLERIPWSEIFNPTI